MLAVAMATVGCSDDIENGPNNGTGNEVDGPTTYMRVAINSDVTTKAPTGGETGDDTEIGLDNERNVNDVTVVLFHNDNTTGSIPLTTLDAASTICAVGWAKVSSQGEGNLTDHYWEATVEVPTENASTGSIVDRELGVIAITNLGENNEIYKGVKGLEGATKISTGKDLAQYLQKEYVKDNNFIMSTHTLGGGSSPLVQSKIVLKNNVSADNIPTANVYVERLAAKVRIKNQDNVTNFYYTIGADESSATAHVALTDVAIVNQLSSGSYLLKNVTTPASATPAIDATVAYLADEVWNTAYNYVIDPWTTQKKLENVNDLPTGLSYINRYANPSTEAGEGIMNLEDAWASYTAPNAPVKLSGATMDDNGGLRLAYTMENTTSAAVSLNGYSTGALFKATYYPVQWSAWNATDKKVAPTNVTYTDAPSSSNIVTGKDFYEYNGNIYENKVAVFAQCIYDAKGENYSYADLADLTTSTITVSQFKSEWANIPEPFGYIDYVSTTIEGETDETKQLSAITGLQSFEDYVMADKTYGEGDAAATFYNDGVCYYVTWIRHANNNNDEMAPMEFAIVRNNIYDLQIQKINGLGMSGTTVPDPGKEDEDDRKLMQVVLYVKDWVVRSNSGIVL